MSKKSKKRPNSKIADELAFYLRRLRKGRTRVSLLPGRCTSAEILIIDLIRRRRLYRAHYRTWEAFCTAELRIRLSTADRAFLYLKKYGPVFFTAMRYLRIRPNQFGKIAAFVNSWGLLVDGRRIPFHQKNQPKLALAAAELLTALRRNTPTVAAAVDRCHDAAAILRDLTPNLDRADKLDLAAAVCEIRKAVAELGVLVAGW